MTLVKYRPTPNDFKKHFSLMNQAFGVDHFDFPINRIINPVVNVKETENDFKLELVAAGLSKDDFNIQLDKNILIVSYQKKEEKSEEKGKYIRREFAHRSFKRSFVLPETVKKEEISGKYEAGILTVTLPKKEVIPAKTIEIS